MGTESISGAFSLHLRRGCPFVFPIFLKYGPWFADMLLHLNEAKDLVVLLLPLRFFPHPIVFIFCIVHCQTYLYSSFLWLCSPEAVVPEVPAPAPVAEAVVPAVPSSSEAPAVSSQPETPAASSDAAVDAAADELKEKANVEDGESAEEEAATAEKPQAVDSSSGTIVEDKVNLVKYVKPIKEALAAEATLVRGQDETDAHNEFFAAMRWENLFPPSNEQLSKLLFAVQRKGFLVPSTVQKVTLPITLRGLVLLFFPFTVILHLKPAFWWCNH